MRCRRRHADRIAGHAMDMIEKLEAHHGAFEDLFHDLGVAREPERRAAIFDELASLLVSHVAVEERLLRHWLGSAPREVGLLASWESRLRVERIITVLAAMDPADASFGTQLA